MTSRDNHMQWRPHVGVHGTGFDSPAWNSETHKIDQRIPSAAHGCSNGAPHGFKDRQPSKQTQEECAASGAASEVGEVASSFCFLMDFRWSKLVHLSPFGTEVSQASQASSLSILTLTSGNRPALQMQFEGWFGNFGWCQVCQLSLWTKPRSCAITSKTMRFFQLDDFVWTSKPRTTLPKLGRRHRVWLLLVHGGVLYQFGNDLYRRIYNCWSPLARDMILSPSRKFSTLCLFRTENMTEGDTQVRLTPTFW